VQRTEEDAKNFVDFVLILRVVVTLGTDDQVRRPVEEVLPLLISGLIACLLIQLVDHSQVHFCFGKRLLHLVVLPGLSEGILDSP